MLPPSAALSKYPKLDIRVQSLIQIYINKPNYHPLSLSRKSGKHEYKRKKDNLTSLGFLFMKKYLSQMFSAFRDFFFF